MKRRKNESGRLGFTLIELIIVMAVVAVIALFGYPALDKLINRNKLLGVATETSHGLRLARYQAIKNSRPTIYSINAGTRLIESWVDDNDDGNLDAGEEVLIRTTLQAGLYLGKPILASGGAVWGFEGSTKASFNPDGSVDAVGGFRFCDHPDNPRNFLEVAVQPRSVARVEIRKWYNATNKWWGRDEGPHPWVWY